MQFLADIVAIIGLGLAGLISAASLENVTGNYIQTHHIPFDLNGSNYTYPWPVKIYHFASQHGQQLQLAFMDVAPTTTPNGKAAILLHGKNFCGPSWETTATKLAGIGYRVILPDHIGFCKSTKPASYQFSLQQMSANIYELMGQLGLPQATIIGHSLGGMTAIRFALMYPANVTELVLTNPIGLEDWKAKGVPYIDTDASWATEKASTYTSIRGYEQSTYYVGNWTTAFDTWVNMLLGVYQGSESLTYTWNQALVVDMVLTQPVAYEFGLIQPKTLMLVGANDTTAIGTQWSPPAVQAAIGHYYELGPEVAAQINGSTLVMFPGLGHAPQIQAPDRYHDKLLSWLQGNLTVGSSTTG